MKPQADLVNNQINPAKLLQSKWTVVSPQNKEKHFLVTEIIRDTENVIVACQIEAVLTRRTCEIEWRLLKNKHVWMAGWH